METQKIIRMKSLTAHRIPVALALAVMLGLVVSIWIKSCAVIPSGKPTATEKPRPSVPDGTNTAQWDVVEFPGIGKVNGIAVTETLEVQEDEGGGGIAIKYTPETLIVDTEGHFLYLRNQAPKHMAVPKLEFVATCYRDFTKEQVNQWAWSLGVPVSEIPDIKGAPDSFRFIGPAKLSLQDPIVKRAILAKARSLSDVYIWGIRVFSPLCGEADVLLVGRKSGGYGTGEQSHVIVRPDTVTKWQIIRVHPPDVTYEGTVIIDEITGKLWEREITVIDFAKPIPKAESGR